MRHREMRFPSDTELVLMSAGVTHRIRFLNVSTTGAKIEGADRPTRDSLVELAYLGARFRARVVWSDDLQTGIRFTPPLSQAELAGLRGQGRHGVGAGVQGGPHRFRELT
jgi:hypothetical protein